MRSSSLAPVGLAAGAAINCSASLFTIFVASKNRNLLVELKSFYHKKLWQSTTSCRKWNQLVRCGHFKPLVALHSSVAMPCFPGFYPKNEAFPPQPKLPKKSFEQIPRSPVSLLLGDWDRVEELGFLWFFSRALFLWLAARNSNLHGALLGLKFPPHYELQNFQSCRLVVAVAHARH